MTTLLLPPDEIAKLRVMKGLAYMLAVMITLDRHYPGRAFSPEQVALVAGMDARTASKQLQDLSTLDRVILSASGYVLTQGGRALFLAPSNEALALSPENSSQALIEAQALTPLSVITPTSPQMEERHLERENLHTHGACVVTPLKIEEATLILNTESSPSDSKSTQNAFNLLTSTAQVLKAGESAVVPEITGYTFEDGTPVFQLEVMDGNFITTREILEATEVIEDFGDFAHGLPVDAIKPELALAWVAKAYDDRARLHNPPAGLVYSRLKDIEKPRPGRKYFKNPTQYLPDEYCESLNLQKYDCKSCLAEKFSTRAAFDAHVEKAHSVEMQNEEIVSKVTSLLGFDHPGCKAWNGVKEQLQMNMPRASFDTWVRDAYAVDFDGHVLTVGVRNAYARDWLESRLANDVNRLLAPVNVRFVVATVDDGESDD